MTSSPMFTKKDYIKLLVESGLIVFSVLLALFLNEYISSVKDRQMEEEALSRIQQELQVNMDVLHEWLPYHKEVLIGLRKALRSDSARSGMVREKSVYYWEVMPRGVVQRLLDDAAWSAMKSSSVFANIEFQRMLHLSKLYKLQSQGVETTLQRVLAIMYSREALNAANLTETLVLLERGFSELVSQEDYLIHQYRQTMEQLGMAAGKGE